MTKQTRSYGTWDSPITADWIVSSGVKFSQLKVDEGILYWAEQRPTEGGRTAIVRRLPDGREQDCIAAPYGATSRVHEYGGGAYTVHGGRLFFVNAADQRLYMVTFTEDQPEEPTAITPESNCRYADLIVVDDTLICVMEEHFSEREPENTLVSIDIPTGARQTLASGHDFYSYPRMSPDAKRFAYTAWDHPNMPWNGTYLYLGDWDGEVLANVRQIAGGPEESIFQPNWSPASELYYVSDRSNWWNLYRFVDGGEDQAVAPMNAEFGLPQWQFGMSTYGFITSDTIVAIYTQDGVDHLSVVAARSATVQTVPAPYTHYSSLCACENGAIYLLVGSVEAPEFIGVWRHDQAEIELLKSSSKVTMPAGFVSAPEAISFPTTGGQEAYGFYYPPTNPDFEGPNDELPPLLVMSHGGPTSSADVMFQPKIQYWTTRGYGVLDVNYGGSTGHGRAYRERLNGKWGIVDLDDCCHGALYLVDRGDVDRDKLAIEGGSAGGYTTLAALTFRDVFRVGASYFGVSDLGLLAKETHKFESRYIEQLIGRYPEDIEVFQERSPIFHVERLSRPIIFFQGADDKVVPPNQAERMVEVLRSKGLPVSYLLYQGEGHGFRRAEHTKRSLEAQLYFFAQMFGLALPEVEPVEIENLR